MTPRKNLINLDQKEEYSTSEREKKAIVVLIIIELMIRYNNNNNDDNSGNNTEGLSTKSVTCFATPFYYLERKTTDIKIMENY